MILHVPKRLVDLYNLNTLSSSNVYPSYLRFVSSLELSDNASVNSNCTPLLIVKVLRLFVPHPGSYKVTTINTMY
jgi:hypothetical protein